MNMTDTPTPEQVAAAAVANAGQPVVKTVMDLKIEKLEARFEALEKENAELRAANAELYAFAAAQQKMQAQAPAQAPAAAQPAQPVGAQVVQTVPAETPDQKENRILKSAIEQLGYAKKEPEADNSGM